MTLLSRWIVVLGALLPVSLAASLHYHASKPRREPEKFSARDLCAVSPYPGGVLMRENRCVDGAKIWAPCRSHGLSFCERRGGVESAWWRGHKAWEVEPGHLPEVEPGHLPEVEPGHLPEVEPGHLPEVEPGHLPEVYSMTEEAR
jgi:hypothetical protein